MLFLTPTDANGRAPIPDRRRRSICPRHAFLSASLPAGAGGAPLHARSHERKH